MRRIATVLAILAAGVAAWLLLRDDSAKPDSPRASAGVTSPGDPARPRARAVSDAPVTQPQTPVGVGSMPDLLAKVVDSDGRPCEGVLVHLLVPHPRRGLAPFESAVTEDDGIARFVGVAARADEEDYTSAKLTVDPPVPEPPAVQITFAALPAEPVVLVMPATGSVRVEIVAGAPLAAQYPFVVRLRVLDADRRFEDPAVYTSDGVVEFPYVALGRQFEVAVARMNRDEAPATLQFAGPVRAGEETVARVTIGTTWPVLTGRLVDRSGAPIGGMKIVADLVDPGSPLLLGTACVADEKGRFAVGFDRAPGASEGVKLRIGRRVQYAFRRTSTQVDALIDLPAQLPSGETDIGDVVVRARGLVVAGVVVDALGAPVSRAEVRVMQEDHGSRFAARDVDAATTDDAGRFRLHGWNDAAEVLVGVAMRGSYVAERAAFAPGTADARIVVRPAGGIAGSVRIPEGIAAASLRVLVQGEPARNGGGELQIREVDEMFVSPDEDGAFEFDALRPGKARVQVRLGWNDDDTVLTVEDVEIVAGRITRDPRLRDVDPAKTMREFRVTVVDRERRLVEGAEVHARRSDSDGHWKKSVTSQGVATVRAPADRTGVDLVVTSRGCRASSVKGVTADTTVVVEDAPSLVVRVRLADTTDLPPEGFTLSPQLAWVESGTDGDSYALSDPRGVEGRTAAGKFGKERLVTLETPNPGRYRVRLMLWEKQLDFGYVSAIGTSPAEVFVTAGTNPVEVVVGVDPEEMEERTAK